MGGHHWCGALVAGCRILLYRAAKRGFTLNPTLALRDHTRRISRVLHRILQRPRAGLNGKLEVLIGQLQVVLRGNRFGVADPGTSNHTGRGGRSPVESTLDPGSGSTSLTADR